jgi:MYXO-CTERM domain-containing protein
MHRHTVLASALASLAFCGLAAAEIVVDLGTVRQIAPRPTLEYNGNFGSHVSGRVDASGVRTVVGFDLFGIANQMGSNLALVAVRVRDGGGNSYGNWSPGADIDMLRIVNGATDGTTAVQYAGVVAQHLGESQGVLASRVATCDTVSGDQHYNSQRFISLGFGGVASLNFAGFLHGTTGGSGGGSNSGGGSGSGGPSGPGSFEGGGNPGETQQVYGGMLVTQGMLLEISEAGLGELYGVELVFEASAIPAPGAMALLALAGVAGRRRRR